MGGAFSTHWRDACKFLVLKSEGKNTSEDLGVEVKIPE
jgi:hypothetical protein